MRVAEFIYLLLNHMYKKFKYIFVLMIVIFVSLIYISEVVVRSLYVVKKIAKDNEVLCNYEDNMFKVIPNTVTDSFEYANRFNRMMKKIRNQYDLLMYDNTNILFEGDSCIYNCLVIDNYLAKLKDINGNGIHLEKKENVSEIAVGINLLKRIRVGTKLIGVDGKEYVVKSVLADNQRWFYGEIYGNGEVINLNDYIVVAPDMEDYDNGISSVYYKNLYFVLRGNGTVDEFITEVSKDEIDVSVMSLHEFGKKVINESINLNLYSCCVVIVLMFSSLIVCITILLTSWMLDYHDIGIMKIMGFGKEISKLIIIENSLVVFFWQWLHILLRLLERE